MKYLVSFSLLLMCACAPQSSKPSTPTTPSAEPSVDTQAVFLTGIRESCQKETIENMDMTKLCDCTFHEYEARVKADVSLMTDSESEKAKQVATEVGTKCALEAVKTAS